MLQVTLKTADLARGTAQTVSVSEKKSSLPILSHFLLEARDNNLYITASDLETTIREIIPAEVISPGRLTVPAKPLASLVRNLNTETVNIREVEQLCLEFTAGQFKTVFFGLSAESFPQLPLESDFSFREMVSEQLIDAIDKVSFSVSARDERFNLSGIYMVLEENDEGQTLRLVSSDSKRLNISTISANMTDFSLDRGILISKKGLLELRRLAEVEDSVSVGVNLNNIMVKSKNSLLVVHLLEGGFPDYRLVIPHNYDKSANISRTAFLDTLKRVGLITDEQNRVGTFEFDRDSLHISVTNASIGKSEETMTIEYEGDPLVTAFNLTYFIEALTNLRSESVNLSFTDPKLSFLLTGLGDPGYFGIVMTTSA
ncbi:MAG: DNA polymerase III subunit beta [Deltaproteobacteria bacterium]|jgi:DNA polymerase-3 subunit beta|nr:DNA polymerase III subunit beta [Deltaproteobacteria bacterium]